MVLGKEKEYYKRIGHSDEKCRHEIMEQGSLLILLTLMHFLARIALETVPSETKEQHAAEYLQEEFILRRINEFHDETHAETSNQGIE